MRQAICGLSIVLAAMAASGCVLFGPRCGTRSVQMNWTDGMVTEMPITVCGVDWRVDQIPLQPKVEVANDRDRSKTESLERHLSRAKAIVNERLLQPLSRFFRNVHEER